MLQWITIISFGIVIILYVYSLFSAENINEVIQSVITLFDGLITIFLCIKIVKVIKLKKTNVPNRIIKLMTWMICFTITFEVVDLFLSYLALGTEWVDNPAAGKGILSMLIWYFVWREYFIRSKRVLTYYGQNAGKLNKVVKKGEAVSF